MWIRLGVAVVLMAAGAGALAAQSPHLRLEDPVTFGVANDGLLVYPTSLAPLPDGGAVLRDGSRVLLFGSDGRYRGEVGRPGQGPGEFGQPWRVNLVGEDIWVADLRRRRFVRFSLAGDHELTGPVLAAPAVRVSGLVLPHSVLSDGSFLAVHQPGESRDGLRILRIAGPEAEPRVVFDVNLAAMEVLLEFPAPGGTGQMGIPNWFGAGDMLAVSPGGRWIVKLERPAPERTEARMVLTLLPAFGEGHVRREVEYHAPPLESSHIEAWLKSLPQIPELVRFGLFRDEARARAAVQRQANLPRFMPAAAGGTGGGGTAVLSPTTLAVSDEGVVWVRLEPHTWQVVSPDGTLASLQDPRCPEILAVSPGFVWCTVRDPYDVVRPVRYRLVSAPGGKRTEPGERTVVSPGHVGRSPAGNPFGPPRGGDPRCLTPRPLNCPEQREALRSAYDYVGSAMALGRGIAQ